MTALMIRIQAANNPVKWPGGPDKKYIDTGKVQVAKEDDQVHRLQ